MRQVSNELKQLLVSNQFIMAELYTIKTIQGNVYRYTNYDYHLTVGGFLYRADGPIIERDTLSSKIGVELDNLNLSISINDDVMLGSIPFIQAVHNGNLDGARFTLERAFMSQLTPTDASAGVIKLFEGLMVEPEFNRYEIQYTVISDLDVLNMQMPRDLWQPACKNTLFDGMCGLNRVQYEALLNVEEHSTTSRIVCSINQPQGYFSQGVIEFTAGPNVGVKRTIRLHETGALLLTLPLLEMPQIGEVIKVYPGCDKRLDTCQNRFNNFPKFRGEPFIPVPETAV